MADLAPAGAAATWARRRARTACATLSAAWLALGMAAVAAAHFGQLPAEAWGPLAWALVMVGASGGGLWLGRYLRRLAAAELTIASLPMAVVAVVAVLAGGEGLLTGAPVRFLLVLPAAWALAGCFGMSIGVLWAGAQAGDWRIGLEVQVAARMLTDKTSPVLSVVTTISMVGVTLGVWLVLVSLAVLGGFERDLEDKIIGSGAHIIIEGRRGRPFVPPADWPQRLAEQPHVVAWASFVSAEVAMCSPNNYAGATLYGVDPQRIGAVLSALRRAEPIALARLGQRATVAAPSTAVDTAPAPSAAAAAFAPALADERPADEGMDPDYSAEMPPPAQQPWALIGAEMARSLGVGGGEVVQAVAPQITSLTPLGPAPRLASFRLSGIVQTGAWEFDARYAFIGLADARRMLNIEPKGVSGMFVACTSAAVAAGTAASLRQALGDQVVVADWQERNRSLFAALKLEKVVAFVVLVFIILVASFSIVNTLTMSIIERRPQIAILRTMGCKSLSVMKIFLLQGLWVGLVGTGAGTALGLLSVGLLSRCRFFLPQDIYYIEALPVQLPMTDVAMVVAAALIIVWDFAAFPAVRGAALTPTEGLRDG